MLEPMVLTPEQRQAVDRMVNEPTNASANVSTMSAGKTLMGVTLIQELWCRTVLIIAPLNTRLGWQKTAERQGVDLPFYWINSTKEGKTNEERWTQKKRGIYFIGVELFVRRGWEGTKRTKVWSTASPDLVIFDEAHRGANKSSKTHRTLMQLKPGYRHSMSGTITGNSFAGAYAPTRWLWPDIVPASEQTWIDQWCSTDFDPFSFSKKKVTGEKVPGAYFNSLPLVIKITPRIDVDVDEDKVYVELSAKQRKIYDDLEDKAVAWLRDNPLVVANPVTLFSRLRQATLGTLNVTDGDEVVFPEDSVSTKLDALYPVLDDDFEGQSALIGCDSQKFVHLTVQRLNERYGEGSAYEWSGIVNGTQRQELKDMWIRGQFKYLVAVIPALAEGVDQMQYATRNVAMLSRSTSRILNEQFLARVHRTGQQKLVRVRDIIAVDTLDDGVMSKQLTQALEMHKSLTIAQNEPVY